MNPIIAQDIWQRVVRLARVAHDELAARHDEYRNEVWFACQCERCNTGFAIVKTFHGELEVIDFHTPDVKMQRVPWQNHAPAQQALAAAEQVMGW